MVGRVAEQAGLRSLLDEPESVFAAVYGRRRVGKTYLVRFSTIAVRPEVAPYHHYHLHLSQSATQ